MATTNTSKGKTWRSFQFLDTEVKTKVVDLLAKGSFGAEIGYKVDGSYVLTNAPVRDFSFALKRELSVALPDATVLDGDPRNGEVGVSADTPVETASDIEAQAEKVAAAAAKAQEAAQRKVERDQAAAVKKEQAEQNKAAKALEREAAKAAKEKARIETAAAKAANSPKSKAALRAEAGEAEGLVLNRNTRMYASTVEVQCGKCQAIKEVHVRSWAGIGYTYCNNCHAKLPYAKSGEGMGESDRKARSFRRSLEGLGRLIEANSPLADNERTLAASLYEAIRHHINAPAWSSGAVAVETEDQAEQGQADDEAASDDVSADQPTSVEV